MIGFKQVLVKLYGKALHAFGNKIDGYRYFPSVQDGLHPVSDFRLLVSKLSGASDRKVQKF